MKNIGPGIAPGFIFENGLFVDTQFNMASDFLETSSLGHSVVVPNHIFNTYNYQINKVLFFKFYPIFFFFKK